MTFCLSPRDWALVTAAAALGGAVVAAATAFSLGQPQSLSEKKAVACKTAEAEQSTHRARNQSPWQKLGRFFAFLGACPAASAEIGKDHSKSDPPQVQRRQILNVESSKCACCSSVVANKERSSKSSSTPVQSQGENLKFGPCLDNVDREVNKSADEKCIVCITYNDAICNGGNNVDPFDPSKRKGYLSWDDYFMAIAFLSAQRSKDPNRQVGACLVSQDRVILGIGYNGFPRGCSDDELPWAKMSATGNPLQTKYPYVCHAEVNAILNKNHASAAGQRLYVTMFPCNDCAKVIIQAGVAEIVYYIDKKKNAAPDYAYAASQRLLSMAGVKLWQHQSTTTQILLEFK